MRVKILSITSALYGNRSTGFGIVIGCGLSQIKIQHFQGAAETGRFRPEWSERGPELPVRHSFLSSIALATEVSEDGPLSASSGIFFTITADGGQY
jgi:hypothetical protein